MTADDAFAILYLLAFGALIFERRAKAKPSACDEVVASCIIKLRETERWAPPGSGFVCSASKTIRAKGEVYLVTVERARSE